MGNRLRESGNEYGAVTGRPRRCGWFDAVAVRYAARINGLDGLALTKLDVLDGLERIDICTAYRCGDRTLTEFPSDVRQLAPCEPVYESMPGWTTPTAGVRELRSAAGGGAQLHRAARRSVRRARRDRLHRLRARRHDPARGRDAHCRVRTEDLIRCARESYKRSEMSQEAAQASTLPICERALHDALRDDSPASSISESLSLRGSFRDRDCSVTRALRAQRALRSIVVTPGRSRGPAAGCRCR